VTTISIGWVTIIPRACRKDAVDRRIVALTAVLLILEAGFEDGLIFRRERRLLSEPGRLARIVLAAADPDPLAFEIGRLRLVLGLRTGGGKHRRQQLLSDRASEKHQSLPLRRRDNFVGTRPTVLVRDNDRLPSLKSCS